MSREEVLAVARARFGIQYQLDPPPSWPTTCDCSLYTREVYKEAGYTWPSWVRTAEQQRQVVAPIGFGDVLPGDLLFFEHTYEPSEPPGPDGRTASHIGLSLGAGSLRMYDANDGRGNSGTTDISTDYWQGHLLSAGRHTGLIEASSELPRGIDVSSHQKEVDWPIVASSGIAFAITKATGGNWYTNPYFEASWLGIQAAGMTRGAYHYAFESGGPRSQSPEQEAEFFLAAVNRLGLGPGDLLALDLEEGSGNLSEWALSWLRRVGSAVGVKPLLYTSPGFISDHGLSSSAELATYPLWLASWQPTMPPAPRPWHHVAFWQNTDGARVPGVSGLVDHNYFNGELAELALYGLPGDPTPPVLDYGPWAGLVGSGLLELMRQDETLPAQGSSTWLPLGQSVADVEECYGLNGTRYAWLLESGQGLRFRPVA